MLNETSAVKNERGEKILQELLRNGEVSVEHLSKRLKISPSTVRRELTESDHTKIGDIGSALICPASDIDLIITDKGVTPKVVAQFAAKKIEMLKV